MGQALLAQFVRDFDGDWARARGAASATSPTAQSTKTTILVSEPAYWLAFGSAGSDGRKRVVDRVIIRRDRPCGFYRIEGNRT